MARTKENVHAEKPQKPLQSDGAVYTYIPRASNYPPTGSNSAQMASPIYGAPPFYPYAYYYQHPMHSTHAYYHPEEHYYYTPRTYHGRDYSHHAQHKPATNSTQYCHQPQHPATYYYEAPQPVYYHQSPWHSYEYMPVEPVYHQPKSDSKTRSLPWYGRTAQEVQDDQWEERKYYEREVRRAAAAKAAKSDDDHHAGGGSEREIEAKSIEPQGKPSDQYWVVHKEGGMRAYPLGTIKNNFEGMWKVDERGWPYLVEK